MNQETIEEMAKEYSNRFGEIDIVINKAVRFGAKWVQERMYSEEEVYEILAQFVNDAPHNTKEWFEHFKKTQRR